MNNRIRAVRKDMKLSQDEFSKRLNLSRQYVALVETGERVPSDRTIKDICDKFGIREEWLRDGIEPMYAPTGREEEMARLVRRLMADQPDSFQSALVTTLLRFDPNGPEWEILERIYNNIAAEMQKAPGE